jgi:hypothetical protein
LRRLSTGVLLLIFLILAGCVISPRRTTTSSGGGGNGTGQLYVSDQSGNAILRFSGATAANGNISPAATISSTALSSPQYIFADTNGNRLYVANLNGGNILVFEKVSTLNGTVTPDRTISSSNLLTPTDVAVDLTKDLLYVADSNEVVVFATASKDNGTTLAQHVLQLTFTPSAILVDGANDRLFAADSSGATVDVFDKASTLNGAVTATRTLTGTDTQLNQPAGLRIDGAGRLIVSNSASPGSITIYNNAATVQGDTKPVTIISGSNTTFSQPAQLAIDPNTNAGELYVADPSAGEVAVFSNITTTTGTQNPSPNRNINGSNTKLTGTGSLTARGVALDTTR